MVWCMGKQIEQILQLFKPIYVSKMNNSSKLTASFIFWFHVGVMKSHLIGNISKAAPGPNMLGLFVVIYPHLTGETTSTHLHLSFSGVCLISMGSISISCLSSITERQQKYTVTLNHYDNLLLRIESCGCLKAYSKFYLPNLCFYWQIIRAATNFKMQMCNESHLFCFVSNIFWPQFYLC